MTTNIPYFDRTFQHTNEWIVDMERQLHLENRDNSFQALKATLQALRDRMPADEAVDFGSQLPNLLAGYYYDNWIPAKTPVKTRQKDEFLRQIRDKLDDVDIGASEEEIAEAVFTVIEEHISEGEVEDILGTLPDNIREMWKQPV